MIENLKQLIKHLFDSRGPAPLFMSTKHTSQTHKRPPRPLPRLADEDYIVSSNDGEAGPGEARLSSIRFGASAHSARQQDTDIGQRRGNVAYLSHSGEQKKGNRGCRWLDKSLSARL